MTAVSRLAAQVATMADPDRLQLLHLIISDPSGEPTGASLAGPGGDPVAVQHHLDVMAAVGLLAEVRRGSERRFRPTSDALARFGGAAIGHGDRRVRALPPSDHTGLLGRITRELAEHYAEVLAPETVERFVLESYQLLAARATVHQHLPALAARFAAERLAALTQERSLVARRGVVDVLFVCVRNAGRSQIAAAVLRSLGGERVRVRSAGSAPTAWVDPAVRAELARRGLDGLTEFPRPLTDEVVRASDVVVTMGCGDACAVVPGRRYLDWSVPDPAGASPDVVASIVDDITARVRTLVAEIVPEV